MKFQMANGTVRDAVKDCDCLTHSGPHWLYMDAFWKERNRELLMTRTELGTRGFIVEENARLQAKANAMLYLGIERIIFNDSECSQ